MRGMKVRKGSQSAKFTRRQFSGRHWIYKVTWTFLKLFKPVPLYFTVVQRLLKPGRDALFRYQFSQNPETKSSWLQLWLLTPVRVPTEDKGIRPHFIGAKRIHRTLPVIFHSGQTLPLFLFLSLPDPFLSLSFCLLYTHENNTQIQLHSVLILARPNFFQCPVLCHFYSLLLVSW